MAPPAPLVPPPMELMTITKRQELMAGGGGAGFGVAAKRYGF